MTTSSSLREGLRINCQPELTLSVCQTSDEQIMALRGSGHKTKRECPYHGNPSIGHPVYLTQSRNKTRM